jgi:hypothetical protein|eukprot:scaffold1610_cov252-Chaetoceros_neogracile.AAC.4
MLDDGGRRFNGFGNECHPHQINDEVGDCGAEEYIKKFSSPTVYEWDAVFGIWPFEKFIPVPV